jgi:hypothetical protein
MAPVVVCPLASDTSAATMKASTKALIFNMAPSSVNEFEIKNRIRILASIWYDKGAISFAAAT